MVALGRLVHDAQAIVDAQTPGRTAGQGGFAGVTGANRAQQQFSFARVSSIPGLDKELWRSAMGTWQGSRSKVLIMLRTGLEAALLIAGDSLPRVE